MRRCANTLMILGIVWLGLSLPLVPATVRRPDRAAVDDDDPHEDARRTKDSLRMTPGIVCRSIDGYEDYKILPKAAQTSDEKLLVYFRPLGFQTELVDGAYQAHLVPDFQIRKRGEKAVLLQKLKMYEYKPRSEQTAASSLHEKRDLAQGACPGRLRPDLDPPRRDRQGTSRQAGRPVSRSFPPTLPREQAKASRV